MPIQLAFVKPNRSSDFVESELSTGSKEELLQKAACHLGLWRYNTTPIV